MKRYKRLGVGRRAGTRATRWDRIPTGYRPVQAHRKYWASTDALGVNSESPATSKFGTILIGALQFLLMLIGLLCLQNSIGFCQAR